MLKNKLVSGVGSLSGVASLLSGWQICHSACLALISLLSVLGITVSIMPFAFLTDYSVIIWSVAMIMLLLSIAMYLKSKCLSRNILLINLGLIIASVPFFTVFQLAYWIIGGLITLTGIYLWFNNKYGGKKNE